MELLKDEIRNKPNIRFEIDVIKRVCNIESQETICESELLEKKKSYEGYRHWYALGIGRQTDADNESTMVRLLENMFSQKDLSDLKTSFGNKGGGGRIHCYKVLLFLALHPQNAIKRKEMSAILWDRKGRKPLTSFETHREILIRLLGIDTEKSPLKKHETYENEQLMLEYVQNEWKIRLKTVPPAI